MKRSFLILGISIAGLASLPSCTKNLKDDIKYLETQVDSLKKRNATLREQAKATQNVLGSDEPIMATTTYKDASGAEKKYQDTYSFKGGNYSTHYMVDLEDGTYEIYIERFSDVEWYEGAWTEFRYNPTTKELTQKRGGQYWENPSQWFNPSYNGGSTGCVVDINLKSINMTTGDISIDFTGTADGTYTAGSSRWPNPGAAHTTKFSFTGKLSVLKRGF
ncbi:hypothetical protein [Paraflavitalea sp. CAU 1676]|uniref:hypothetical protein n=1 Tax=Paraflavitalea sp. CAU 1676 TaxID=3032598 RepID=UPI0023D9D7FF|nr:hypothetical protein [Paraflavitalea sp. CAU 1676]MDF2191523.1 hypothetical protein [Paraflavitalea sp. CAU 1676]